MLIHPTVVPRTELGRWSLGLIGAPAGCLTFFVVAVWAGLVTLFGILEVAVPH